MRATLLELHREFLPGEYDENSLNALSFSASVNGFKYKPKDDEDEKVEFNWNAHFIIRIDNTTIRLHEPPDDVRLAGMEAKLKLLKDELLFVVKTFKKRAKKPGGEQLLKREWLNPLEPVSGYTGYIFYMIDEKGSGRCYISDCHRTINWWLDPCTDLVIRGGHDSIDYNELNRKVFYKQLEQLQRIAEGAGRCIQAIHKLRKEFKTGVLKEKLGAVDQKEGMEHG